MSEPDYKTLYLDLVGRLEGWAVQLNCPTREPLLAAELRHRINRARKWQLTGDGHGQHVEEDK